MIELSLPGMTCGGCARGVIKTVQEIDPTAVVEPDVENRRARIQSTAPEGDLRAALTEAGYLG